MFTARVRSARMLSARVREVTFAPPPGFAFEPGQYVELGVDGAPMRPYSIASAPREDGGFEIAVTRVPGSASTDALFALTPGRTVSLSRAQGDFVLGTVKRPVLFIATGTGVAPVRAMLQKAPRDRAMPPFGLLFGVRTEDDLIYAEDFRSRSRDWGLRFWPVVTEAGPGWPGRRGLVQDHLAVAVREMGGDCDLLACGHGDMVRDVRRIALREVSLAADRVRSERYD